jgi:hypothetical protein
VHLFSHSGSRKHSGDLAVSERTSSHFFSAAWSWPPKSAFGAADASPATRIHPMTPYKHEHIQFSKTPNESDRHSLGGVQYRITYRLNMEVDLQSLFGLHVT